MAISRVRAPTAANIVFIAPKMAPTAMMSDDEHAGDADVVASPCDWFGVEVVLALHLDAEPRVGLELLLERREARRVLHAEGDAREVAAARATGMSIADVAPDLGLERGAAGREDARPP